MPELWEVARCAGPVDGHAELKGSSTLREILRRAGGRRLELDDFEGDPWVKTESPLVSTSRKVTRAVIERGL